MTTFTYKKYKFGNKTYKFKEPLKIQINNFVLRDGTVMSELVIPIINDGYSKAEIKDKEKEIKWYLNYLYETILSKKDEELSSADKEYKKRFLNLIQI